MNWTRVNSPFIWLLFLAFPVKALEINGSFQTRSVYALVLEKELFTEFVASIELGEKFKMWEKEISFKLSLDPSFDLDAGKSRFDFLGLHGLDEAYFAYSASRWDLRVGLQKMAWGRGDGIVPNDIINAKERTRFLVDSELEQKIANFMVRTAYYGQSGTVEAVWIPAFEGDRFPPVGDPFFPPTLDLNASLTLLGFPIPTTIEILPEDNPDLGFKRSELGLRMAATFGPLDSQLYLFFGYDRQPVYTPTVHFYLETLPQNLSVVDLLDSEAKIDITPRHPPIWQIGMDVTSTLGPVVIRAEAAFLQGRHFNWKQTTDFSQSQMSDLLASTATTVVVKNNVVEVLLPELVSTKDSATFLVGLDYPVPAFENWELFVSGQIIQQRIYNIDTPLVFEPRETSLTALMRLSQSGEKIQFEAAANLNYTRLAYLAQMALIYRLNDHWKARLSLISLGGQKGSLLADFQALDLATFELNYFW